MTQAIPFTKARLRRAIEAAREAGLRVTGIRPDGTLLLNDGDNLPRGGVQLPPEGDTAAISKWGDMQA
jgi:hypothetical protein